MGITRRRVLIAIEAEIDVHEMRSDEMALRYCEIIFEPTTYTRLNGVALVCHFTRAKFIDDADDPVFHRVPTDEEEAP